MRTDFAKDIFHAADAAFRVRRRVIILLKIAAAGL